MNNNMSQVGKLLFIFVVASICFTGALSILSLSMSAGPPAVNLGNNSVYTDPTSAINVTGELLASTSGYGLGFTVVILFIISALILLSAVALLSRGKHR